MMGRVSLAAAVVVALAIGPSLPMVGRAAAHDYGQAGEAWPIIEPDLLQTIQARLQRAQATGEMDRLNKAFVARAERKVMRPTPVAGITAAVDDKTWEYDPSITIDNDIRDTKGNIIGRRGQRINPLNMVALPRQLLFINGDRPEELAWAMRQGDDLKAMIILVDGSPFEQMKRNQRRFYFDQTGSLTSKFGISHTPAFVRQKGDMLLVGEVALKGKGA